MHSDCAASLSAMDIFLVRLGYLNGQASRCIYQALRDQQITLQQLASLNACELQAFGFNQQQINILSAKTTPATVQKALAWHQPERQQFVLTLAHSRYPALLKQISAPPLVLLLHGNWPLLAQPQIAMVGSRNATHSGICIATKLSRELAQRGICISSGLASGIDAAAHRGALQASGHTLAVLGCGINIVYPKRNAALYDQILEQQGLLLSEFYPDAPACRHHFPRRNRIVSGLALGTVVVEAALKSGSLITAFKALEQNREVFAVPGNPLSPAAAGTNSLIQQGAKLVLTAADILEEFQHLNLPPPNAALENPKKSGISYLATDTLLDSVEFDVTAIDIITERSGLPISEVLAALLEYELRGLVASVPGGYVKLRGK